MSTGLLVTYSFRSYLGCISNPQLNLQLAEQPFERARLPLRTSSFALTRARPAEHCAVIALLAAGIGNLSTGKTHVALALGFPYGKKSEKKNELLAQEQMQQRGK